MLEIIAHHRSSLPHHQEEEQILSINWRLAYTLPRVLNDILQELQDLRDEHSDNNFSPDGDNPYRQRYAILRMLYDETLARHPHPDVDLATPMLAPIVTNSIKFYDRKMYILHAYCLMPNHVHLLIKPIKDASGRYSLCSDIVKRIKSYSAKEINKLLGRCGELWDHEYYDRYIRNPADYNRTVEYILNNPLKAGLVNTREKWPYSYFYPEALC